MLDKHLNLKLFMTLYVLSLFVRIGSLEEIMLFIGFYICANCNWIDVYGFKDAIVNFIFQRQQEILRRFAISVKSVS